MASRAEIIRKTNAKARKQLLDLVLLQERRVTKVFEDFANLITRVVQDAEKAGKIPIGSSKKIRDEVILGIGLPKIKQGEVYGVVPPGVYKDLNRTITQGLSLSADSALKNAILTLDAAGIARRAIQIGSSFIGADGQVRRFNAAKQTFLQSTWRKVNGRVVDAVKAWRPGGVAFSERVWDIGYTTQKQMLNIVQQGIVRGQSASSMSRDIREFLVQPKTLRGKALKNYHPGRGVYKSAYKNAMRLTRTETTRAHGQAMIAYVQSKEFLDGFIWRRGSLGVCSSGECPENADQFYTADTVPDYPPHPQCMCYLEPHIKDDPVIAAGKGK